MPRGGEEDVKGGGGTEIFSGNKGGLRYTEGGGGYKLFKVLVQQWPVCSLPPYIVNIIDGLETH